ncbi:MAG: hypothetical protein QM747_08760 [Nocardioides sp.]
MTLGLAFLTALLVTLVVTRPTTALLIRRRVLDVPNRRSSHDDVVPRGGGLAVLAGLAAGALVGAVLHGHLRSPWAHPFGLALALVLGTGALALVGLRDDLGETSAAARLVAQTLLALGSVALLAWAAPGSDVGWLVVVGAVWTVGYVNAFNFMDGVNGISAVVAALGGGWFCLLGAHAHDGASTVGGAALAGAALGFLPWNAPRARVFLGDVGSYGVGSLLALLAVVAVVRDDNLWWGVAPALVYVADTSWTLVRRLRHGEPVLRAHRTHVYQRLTDHGLSHVASTAVVGGCTAVVLAVSWLLPTALAVVLSLAVAAAYLCLPALLSRRVVVVAR